MEVIITKKYVKELGKLPKSIIALSDAVIHKLPACKVSSRKRH